MKLLFILTTVIYHNIGLVLILLCKVTRTLAYFLSIRACRQTIAVFLRQCAYMKFLTILCDTL